MNSKRLICLLCLVVLLGSMLALGKNATSDRNFPSETSQNTSAEVFTVPESVIYGFLFLRVSRLSEKTRELRSQGQIGQEPYFPMQKEASLTEAQSMALEAIASACQQDVARQDARAKKVIESFKARFPDRKIPQGTTLPAPPLELKSLWEERNAMILRARDQLRQTLGDEAFARFDNFAKFRYATHGGSVSPSAVGLTSK